MILSVKSNFIISRSDGMLYVHRRTVERYNSPRFLYSQFRPQNDVISIDEIYAISVATMYSLGAVFAPYKRTHQQIILKYNSSVKYREISFQAACLRFAVNFQSQHSKALTTPLTRPLYGPQFTCRNHIFAWPGCNRFVEV